MNQENFTNILKLGDLVAFFLASSFAYWLRFDSFEMPSNYLMISLTTAGIGILSLHVTGAYTRRPLPTFTLFSKIAVGVVLTLICLSLVYYLSKTGADVSRLWSVFTLAFSLFLILLTRLVLAMLSAKLEQSVRIITIGNNSTAVRIHGKLSSDETKGVCSKRRFSTLNEEVLKFIEQSRSSGRDQCINEVWLTLDVFSKMPTANLRNFFSDASVRLVFVPEMPDDDGLITAQIDHYAGFPIIDSGLTGEFKVNRFAKRLFDLTVSGLLLVCLSPLLLVVSIAIKLTSAGPIFYTQTRYGLSGKEFRIIKFRSMTVSERDDQYVQATKGDARVTKLGRLLRRTSIDELPQLLNVLNGDMSLVGPRPLPKSMNEHYRSQVPGLMKRHLVKPGITGLAQISGARGETKQLVDMQRRIDLDLEYVENWSLILDIKILVATVLHVITTQEAY